MKKLVQYNEEETYDQLLQICRRCQVLSDVRRLRSDLVIVISKVEAHKGPLPIEFRLTVERLELEGRPSSKRINSLLKRLEDIKSILDQRIVSLSGKSIRRVPTSPFGPNNSAQHS